MGKIKTVRVHQFGFKPGTLLAEKYEVVSFLGSGWEGEVYRVRERGVGVERAAKIFFPQRNLGNRATRFYARKLHKLRHCPILTQYHTHESTTCQGIPVSVLVSDYVDGDLLDQFIKRQPGQRLTPFEGLHLLYALSVGVETIHQAHEYHGDLHADNVFVQRKGLSFLVKLVDIYNWGRPTADHYLDDVCDMIRIFYQAIGGARHYARHPLLVKRICCGLKRSLIKGKFRTAGQLRHHLENMAWPSG